MNHKHRFPDSVFYCWLVILVWAPLPQASNLPWAVLLLVCLTVLLAGNMLGLAIIRGLPVYSWLSTYRLPVILLALVVMWIILQVLPLPLGVIDFLSPNTGSIYKALGRNNGSLSLDPARSLMLSVFSVALWLHFCMALLLLDDQRRIRLACMVIVYCGVFQALYGSFMTLSGIEYGFFYEKQAFRGVATGTFVARAHLASYLEMCLAVGIGLLVSSLSNDRSQNWRVGAGQIIDALLGSKMRLRIFLALMVIALVLTRSRMGNTAFFASLMICGGLWMLLRKRLHTNAIILFVSLLLVDTLIVGQWFGFEELAERLENTSTESESRDEVVRDTLVMVRDFPLTGTGLGSYSVAFPGYQQADVRGFYDNTHNDYLQFMTELGLIGMLPLGGLVICSLGVALIAMKQRRDQLARGLAFAAVMAILSLLIHSTVDFNLQMPANALLFVVILALAWLSRALQHE